MNSKFFVWQSYERRKMEGEASQMGAKPGLSPEC